MKRKTVSLCMIARDEEACIGKAIKSALALVDEIVVVDTGSQDNTRIIAEGYGARVVDLIWNDDFAEARNAALAAASCDWVLVLDCDEQLQSVRPVDFQRLLADPGVAGYRVGVVEPRAGETARPQPDVRLFRSHPDVRYRYPVFEQVLPSLATLAGADGLVIADSPLLLVHEPGISEQRARKRERNLRLLRQAIGSHPQEPFFAFQLGRETLQRLDGEVLPVAGLRVCLQQLEAAWSKVAALPPEMRRLVTFGRELAADLGAALITAGDPAVAADVLAAARRDWGDDTRLATQAVRASVTELMRTDCAQTRERLAARVRRELDRLAVHATSAPTALERVARLVGHDCRGELALCEGDVAAAAEAFEQALNVDPDHSPAWVGLAECARLAGDRNRALRLYLRAVTACEWNVRAWERGCSLMEELGFHDNAASWRAHVREQFPERCHTASEGSLQPA
jgi:Tfp pilus assembly protein PilF